TSRANCNWPEFEDAGIGSSCSSNSLTALGSWAFGDWNADGATDAVNCLGVLCTLNIYQATGQGFVKKNLGVNNFDEQMADYNGEGRPELVTNSTTSGTITRHIYEFDGTSFYELAAISGNTTLAYLPGDYNGDGKTDIRGTSFNKMVPDLMQRETLPSGG